MSEPDVNAAFDNVIAVVRDRLSRNVRIRRNLPGGGRLKLDRQLPFLCVYRDPPQGGDNGTRELVTTEAAYLFASGEAEYADGIDRLCHSISETLREHFGKLLLIEFWTADDRGEGPWSRTVSQPAFRIVAPEQAGLQATLAALEEGLREVRLHGTHAETEIAHADQPAPPGQPPLALGCDGCVCIGVGVRPVYRDARTGALFPMVLKSLRRQLAVAVRKAVFAFTGADQQPPLVHYEALGPSTMAKASREVDQQLCEISQLFDFLLQVTPVNSVAAWEEFSKSGHRRLPTFYYRPLPYHPTLLKRQLYSLPIEHVEDSTLAHLFDQKQEELGKKLDALKDIGMPAFLYHSLQLYGKPGDKLVQLADDILVETDAAEDPPPNGHIASAEVAAAAREHIDYYHLQLPGFHATVELCNTIASSLMVAHDRLLISETANIRDDRLQPLLHHEVGTHLLTYFNGRQQPLRQLYAGFAGYEPLQEGLAVLAEYLVGGLSLSRARTLAARVAAVHSMIEGATFIETFDLLHKQRGVGSKTAFMTTLRVFRGGGLTKDYLYLRGLRDLLDYLRRGHDLEPLYVGKISLEHVPLVQELRRRGLVQPPALLPRFWQDNSHDHRLADCRRMSLVELLEQSP